MTVTDAKVVSFKQPDRKGEFEQCGAVGVGLTFAVGCVERFVRLDKDVAGMQWQKDDFLQLYIWELSLQIHIVLYVWTANEFVSRNLSKMWRNAYLKEMFVISEHC